MAFYRDTRRKPKTGTATKVAAGLAAAAALVAAKKALDRRYAKRRTDKTRLEWSDDCALQVMCPQLCDLPSTPGNRVIYQVPVLSTQTLVAQLNDSVRISNLTLKGYFEPIPQGDAEAGDIEAWYGKPYRMRAMLVKQKVTAGEAALGALSVPDPFDQQDWSDYPALKRWEYLHIGGFTAVAFTHPNLLVATPVGLMGFPKPVWTTHCHIKQLRLHDEDDLSLFVTYGGLNIDEDASCTPPQGSSGAVKVGFRTWFTSQATLEL